VDNKKDKRRLIIEAAMKIFARDGFHKATISDIAEVAGIGKGTVYEYFNSKTELFEDMIKHTLEVCLENIEIILENNDSFMNKLRSFVVLAITLTQRHLDMGRIYSHETGLVCENIINMILDNQKRIVEMIEQVLREGVESKQLRPVDLRIAALSFIGGLKHIIMYNYFVYNRSMTESEIDEYIDIFVRGLIK